MKKQSKENQADDFSSIRKSIMKKTLSMFPMLVLFVCLLAAGCGRQPAESKAVQPKIIQGELEENWGRCLTL
jgi:hypothetical protein